MYRQLVTFQCLLQFTLEKYLSFSFPMKMNGRHSCLAHWITFFFFFASLSLVKNSLAQLDQGALLKRHYANRTANFFKSCKYLKVRSVSFLIIALFMC